LADADEGRDEELEFESSALSVESMDAW